MKTPSSSSLFGSSFIVIGILLSSCCQMVFTSSPGYPPVYFPIDNATTLPSFANHTKLENQKVILVRTNHPVSVILPDKTPQGKSQLQKVSKQVFQRKEKKQHRCATVATNGGPFNADGTCVGPVVSQGQLQRDVSSSWPGFGRGVDATTGGHVYYVFGEYSEIVQKSNMDNHNNDHARNNSFQQHRDNHTKLNDFVTGFSWLVYDGRIVDDEDNPTGAIQAPRTAIGMDRDGHTILLVADGCERCPPPYHRGMTLEEVAMVLVEQAGARYAINLDGGSSSTMLVDGKVVNRPTCLDVVPVKCQRPVATVLCVDTPAMGSKEEKVVIPEKSWPGDADGDEDDMSVMHTRTTRRKGTVP